MPVRFKQRSRRSGREIDMDADELLRHLNARPFAAFQLQIRGGNQYEIRRPGMAIVTQDTVFIGLPKRNGSRLAERIIRCPINDILHVERIEAAQA
jgi:hypothetical protein